MSGLLEFPGNGEPGEWTLIWVIEGGRNMRVEDQTSDYGLVFVDPRLNERGVAWRFSTRLGFWGAPPLRPPGRGPEAVFVRFSSCFQELMSCRSDYHNNGVLCGVPGSLFGLKLFREEWQRSTLRLPGVDAFSFRVCFCNPRVRISGKVHERGAVEEAGLGFAGRFFSSSSASSWTGATLGGARGRDSGSRVARPLLDGNMCVGTR